MTQIAEITDPTGFIETPTAKRIIRHAEYCCDRGEIGVIVGAPGTGKTFACRYLSNEYSFPMLTLSPDSARLRTAKADILDAISLGEASCYEHDRRDEHIKKRVRAMAEVTGNTLLIVDEAQHAGPDLLEHLRYLHDYSDDRLGRRHLGLLFVGNPNVLNRMYADQKRRQPRPEYLQLISRFGLAPLDLRAPENGDVQAICVARGVDDAAAHRLLERISRAHGGVRAVTKVLDSAKELAGERPISVSDLEQAATMRGVQVGKDKV